VNHKNDLSFLCDIFKKHHIDASLISPGDLKSHTQDTRLTRITGCNKTHEELEKIADNFLQSTKYILTNELRLKYVFFKTLVSGERNVLLIGPYLSAPLNKNDIFRISTQFNCGTDSQKLFNDYYASIPILPENDKLFVILDIFCERMWQTSSLSTVVISNTDNSTVDIMPKNAANEKKYDEIIKNAEQLEMRYAIENEMLNAVRLGQENKEKNFSLILTRVRSKSAHLILYETQKTIV
jgi:hypothetical protein